jgi:hypothetical protein
MEYEPAAFDREIEPRRLFCRCRSINVQERTVDFLDVNTAILHHLEGVSVLHQTARGLLRIGKGAVGGELHCDMLFVTDLISQPKQ